MVDKDGYACLADFGLLTMVDPTYTTASSSTNGAGTMRWMSPELHNPKLFNLEDCRPTNESDCYALGMVILEVLSGRAPYVQIENRSVLITMITEGKRPERPGRPWFTDNLWRNLEQCWSQQPKDRPTIAAILECLERLATTWRPLPPGLRDDDGMLDDETDPTVSHRRAFRYFVSNLVLRLHRRLNPVGMPRTSPQRCRHVRHQ